MKAKSIGGHRSDLWRSEAAMFAAFQADAEREGWLCYPETCGHDLLLEAGPALDLARWRGVERGDIVVVEGKLRESLKVLEQAAPPWTLPYYLAYNRKVAADWYAVLVPGSSHAFRLAARGLRVLVFHRLPDDPWGPGDVYGDDDEVLVHPASGRTQFVVDVSRHGGRCSSPVRVWPESWRAFGYERLQPPLRVEGLVAGQPAPASVTRWKVGAVRVCLQALDHPEREVTTAAFKAQGVEPSTWVARGWIRKVRREGRVQVYQLADPWAGQGEAPPHLRYPEITDALRREG